MDERENTTPEEEKETPEVFRPWGDAEHDPVLHSKLRPKATPKRSYDPDYKHYKTPPG